MSDAAGATMRKKTASAVKPIRPAGAREGIARTAFSGDGETPLSSNGEALLSIEDVAEILKLPVSWVYDRTRRRSLDRIPGFRLGKYWRFRRAEIMEWIERQRAGARRSA
ncbi:MAG TPA: helix-turn-helix domain-containing protein [Candidatus Acidoferrales bacterium]|nr:helix-turn-helix domain-containing protein [Candidatus Acidoferrales bacterium]